MGLKLIIIFGVTALAALGSYAMVLADKMIVAWPLLIIICSLLTAGAALFAFLRLRSSDRELHERIIIILGAAVTCFVVTCSAALIINYHTADPAAGQHEMMEICRLTNTTKYRSRRVGRRGMSGGRVPYHVYRMYVIDAHGDTLDFQISKADYRSHHRGDKVEIASARGLLGWRVIDLEE